MARLEAIAADLRRRRPSIEQVAAEVERIVEESGNRIQQLAEIELHLQAARDPALQEASLRCFEAYEGVAAAALEMLEVPDAERHARTVVAADVRNVACAGSALGSDDASGIAEALLTIVRGAAR